MITSISNQRVKNVKALLSSKKERSRQGLYVIEGVKLFEEAPADKIKEVYVSESFLTGGKIPELISKKLENTGYETVVDTVFDKMSDTVTPQGILCVIQTDKYDISSLCDNATAGNSDGLHSIVLEGLQDPGNLGTILRSAEAAGFDLIIADKDTADVYSPKVIRSTMGAVFRVPVVYTDDILDTVGYLKQQGITIYAAHLKAEKSYRDIEYKSSCVFLIGNEGNGLSDEITALADTLVKIPMHGKTESLNAAVAASLLMFEVNA